MMKIVTFFKEINKYSKAKFLIYQMAKIGSSSIEEVLNINNISNIHLHSLYFNYQFNYNKLKPSKIGVIKNKILLNARLSVIKIGKNKVKIVTGVREPISRNISAMFQNLHELIYEYMSEDTRKIESLNDMLLNVYNKYIFHEWPLKWFDIEMKKYLGIDVYEYPFDKEKGYGLIKTKKYDILIIKMEKMNELENVIGEFIKIKNFKLKKANDGSKKWYSEMYKEFKKNFLPSREYVEKMYNSKYMKHFYTDEEIQKFKERWLKNR